MKSKLMARNMRISAILPTRLVMELKKISTERGVTQSSLIEKALGAWLRRKLDEDTKVLAELDLGDLPSEDEWMEIQTKI